MTNDQLINDKIKLITDKLSFDKLEKEELINTLKLFNDHNMLDIINDESLSLFYKIFDNELDEIDVLYFSLRIKFLLLPYYLINCEYEINLSHYLTQYEMMINWMIMNYDNQDLLILSKYNRELSEVVKRLQNIINKYEESDLVKYGNITDTNIIINTMSHFALIFYLKISDYQFNYNLLDQMFIKLINNYNDFLFEIRINNLFKEEYGNSKKDEDIINEYKICIKMLDEEYNPSIKLVKRS